MSFSTCRLAFPLSMTPTRLPLCGPSALACSERNTHKADNVSCTSALAHTLSSLKNTEANLRTLPRCFSGLLLLLAICFCLAGGVAVDVCARLRPRPRPRLCRCCCFCLPLLMGWRCPTSRVGPRPYFSACPPAGSAWPPGSWVSCGSSVGCSS